MEITDVVQNFPFHVSCPAFLSLQVAVPQFCWRLWIEFLSVTIQMKATEQYFPVVFFITLYKVVRTFESVGEFLKCDNSNEGCWAVLSYGAWDVFLKF